MSFFYLVYYFSIYLLFFLFFFFNHTPTTEIYTLSLHDALPICFYSSDGCFRFNAYAVFVFGNTANGDTVEGQQFAVRSEEHTSELQSRPHLVCRLLLEKKKKIKNKNLINTKQY